MSRGGYAMNEMLLELGQNAKEAENMLRTITNKQKEPGACGSCGTSCGMYR